MSQNEEWMMKDDESMIDIKVYWGFALRLMDERKFAIVELLLQLKIGGYFLKKNTLFHF